MSRPSAKRKSSANTDNFTISVAKALVNYNRLAEHWNAAVKAQGKASRELNQAMFRAAAVVLRAYHVLANWPAGASSPFSICRVKSPTISQISSRISLQENFLIQFETQSSPIGPVPGHMRPATSGSQSYTSEPHGRVS